MNELAFLHERMPWMWIPAIWYASTYGMDYDRHLKILTDFTRKVINEKLAEREQVNPLEPKKKKAFLDLLLDVQSEGNLTYEDIREEVDTFMSRHDLLQYGMDTLVPSASTTMSIQNTRRDGRNFWQFRPELYRRRPQVDEVLGEMHQGVTSAPTSRAILHQESRK
ncbi:hypothetical protein OESDEN_07632 [Oesophagostomum dentatum]|uniref:Uncharacterized protein n=1 Tax=Oesophagostomum dentatum TaxID=61180 RepID=A0A0B1TAT2_OESDE|nr:hypothetical protein OESDEN_07632 [Oesophagostomum dentatum]